MVHIGTVTAVRRTISLPPALARQLDDEAKRRSISFSALIAELLSERASHSRLPYAGLLDDDHDLSDKVEEVLQRLATSS